MHMFIVGLLAATALAGTNRVEPSEQAMRVAFASDLADGVRAALAYVAENGAGSRRAHPRGAHRRLRDQELSQACLSSERQRARSQLRFCRRDRHRGRPDCAAGRWSILRWDLGPRLSDGGKLTTDERKTRTVHPPSYVVYCPTSVLDLFFVIWAFAHFGARLVFLIIVLVVDQGLEDHLGRRWLLAQIAGGDLGRKAADDEAVELA